MQLDAINQLADFIQSQDGIANKQELSNLVKSKFLLTKDRSVFYNDKFAIRFSYSKSSSFSNTVISLSNLQKYDDMPFIVCLVTPVKNYLFLANTTFISKVSHSSQALRRDNIRGSINGSDIVRRFNDIENCPRNFEILFPIHSELGFEGNLDRLVEATNNISPSGQKASITAEDEKAIMDAPRRAKDFVDSNEYSILKKELDSKTEKYQSEIVLASLIENVNIRGRIIEYIIAGEDERLREELINALRTGIHKIPSFRTKNTLGDYCRIFEKYDTATDIKTKVMVLNSAPKAYNLDKMLEFLVKKDTVFLFYFVGILPKQIVGQVLISMFQDDLRDSTHILKHWAGRNSRDVSQFNGQTIDMLIKSPNNSIDIAKSQTYLKKIIET